MTAASDRTTTLVQKIEALVLQRYTVSFAACPYGYRCDIDRGDIGGFNGVGASLDEAFDSAMRTFREQMAGR